MAKKRSSAASDQNSGPAASFKYEVILWAVLALSIILFISNFGIAGAAGNLISSIFFGLFGMTAYIFPILLFAGTAFIIANQENTVAMVKAAAALGFFIFVCMFLELVSGSAKSQTPLDAYLWSAEHKFGGGLCGGILTWLIRPNLGTISAYVIDVIMLIICLVLITQRSLWKPIQSGSKKVYTSAKNETIRQRQQYQERRQRRMDNKVSGVSIDTSLKNTAGPGASDNVCEIRPDPALLQDFPIYMMNQPMPRPSGEKSRQEKPKQQEEPGIRQNLAAAGMGYPEVLPVHEQHPLSSRKASVDSGTFDKIIPITNRKVSLQPNTADHVQQGNTGLHPASSADAGIGGILQSGISIAEKASTSLQPGISAAEKTSAALQPGISAEEEDGGIFQSGSAAMAGSIDKTQEDDFFARSHDLFSELLPGGKETDAADGSVWDAMDDIQPEPAEYAGWDAGNEILTETADIGSENADIGSEHTEDGMPTDTAADILWNAGGNPLADDLTADLAGSGREQMPADLAGSDREQMPADLAGSGREQMPVDLAEPANRDGESELQAELFSGSLSGPAGAVSAYGRQKTTEADPDWNIVPDSLFAEDSAEEPDMFADTPPLSAEELMDQQLRAAAMPPRRVSAVAPVAAGQGRETQKTVPEATRGQAAPKPSPATIHKQPKQSAAEALRGAADVQMQITKAPPKIKREYILPPVDLLKFADSGLTGDSREHLQETALKLQQTLKNFGVNVTILNVSCGPSVTRYEIQPEMGVKVSKIVNLADDIKLNLAAADIRIEAPIPGKAAIGIEVPNKETVPVMFRDLIESEAFRKQTSPCTFAAGKDISGQVVVTDICKMPHLLIAGATGSGKSVCINTIIMSIIYKADPDDVKLIMIDPKVVELSVYNGIPHLLLPVVTDPKKAAGALHWAVSEMMDRYQKFADYGVRDIKGYNAKIQKIANLPDENKPQKMPYIVIIVDELADLMMAAPGDVEDAICRLAQLARAAGIHLIIATQRPSVNVITGLIKANMPSRIAFSVTSGIDSRTILDMNGAEKLLGKGDMLFYPQGFQKPVRVQGAFVSDAEVSDVVEFLTERNGTSEYDRALEQQVVNAAAGTGTAGGDASAADDKDVYFADAARLLMDKEKASVSMLQRYFKIGFHRAARIMDQLEEAGVVGPEEGTKPRKIMMTPEEFAQYEEEVL